MSTVQPYRHLVSRWYAEYPHLKAKQIFERLSDYGYPGSYASVQRFTKKYRRKKTRSFLALNFLPGEEAQIDWFFYKTAPLGQLAGFLYLLSYSRYAWGGFYQRTGFEFFIQAHLDAFKHLKGLGRTHRYDNLKSVVLKRSPEIQYNPKFLDFARHYGFKIHACNPYSGNEKGRVERLIRDIRSWLYDKTFETLPELNRAFHTWLNERNNRIHRTTEKSPSCLLAAEKLIPLPQNPYSARKIVLTRVLKTSYVEFETNRYSVPSGCAGKPCEIVVSPETIKVCIDQNTVASHQRCFDRKQILHNPLHTEKDSVGRDSAFKMKRIYNLIQNMEHDFGVFLSGHADETNRQEASYEIFRLLKSYSRGILTSAVRELNRMRCFKVKALKSLLGLPSPKDEGMIHPSDHRLLGLKYDERNLKDYDPD